MDNDGDGRTDFPQDPGCEGASDGTEAPDPAPPAERPEIEARRSAGVSLDGVLDEAEEEITG